MKNSKVWILAVISVLAVSLAGCGVPKEKYQALLDEKIALEEKVEVISRAKDLLKSEYDALLREKMDLEKKLETAVNEKAAMKEEYDKILDEKVAIKAAYDKLTGNTAAKVDTAVKVE